MVLSSCGDRSILAFRQHNWHSDRTPANEVNASTTIQFVPFQGNLMDGNNRE